MHSGTLSPPSWPLFLTPIQQPFSFTLLKCEAAINCLYTIKSLLLSHHKLKLLNISTAATTLPHYFLFRGSGTSEIALIQSNLTSTSAKRKIARTLCKVFAIRKDNQENITVGSTWVIHPSTSRKLTHLVMTRLLQQYFSFTSNFYRCLSSGDFELVTIYPWDIH